MKKFLFVFIASCLTMTAFSQSTFTIRNQTEKFQKAVTTTNATATKIDTITVADNEAGQLEIKVIGYNEVNSASFIGTKFFTYKKTGGTLTVPAAAYDSSQTQGITGSGFTVTATAYGNIQTKVVGAASTTVKWISITKQYFRKND